MKFKITKKIVFRIVIILIIAFIAIQFVTVEKTNPPVTGEISLPPDVKAVMQKSCYDCHSNETVWPWYSSIAPVSWLVSKDVIEGRDELNFSEWNNYTEKRQTKKLKEILEEIDEGKMPMPIYTIMHWGASLTDVEKGIIREWVNSYNTQTDSMTNKNTE